VKTRHRTATYAALALGLGALLHAAPVGAQSAGDVLQTALDRYEQRMKGVDDYTVTFTSSVMSGDYTVYYEKKMVDGHAVFVAPRENSDAQAASEWGNPYQVLPRIADRATLQGHASVDGHDTFVIHVDDLSGLDFGQEALGQNGEAQLDPKSMTMNLDSEDYLIRRMRMDGTITREGKTNPVHVDAHMKDYRSVKGLMQPYAMDMTMTGLDAAISEEDRAQARAWMARMDSMPADKRAMMEQMMGPQLQRMKEILESGKVDVSIQVKDVKVNAGPPKAKAGSPDSTGR